MKRIFIFLLALNAVFTQAQKPAFYLGFDEIFDNREFNGRYGMPQTIFAERINSGLRFSFDSIHSIRTGINYMYENGHELLAVRPQIDLSYHYSGSRFEAAFGSFSRRQLMDYPLILLSDSLDYYRPNLEGGSLAWNWTVGRIKGRAHYWIDWMGRQTTQVRESILTGLDLKVEAGIIYAKLITVRYHLARTRAEDDQNSVYDEGAFLAMLGLELSKVFGFDELDISSGYMKIYEWPRRTRLNWFQGWYSEIRAGRGIFDFKAAHYLGEGFALRFGHPLYAADHYGRLDFFIDPFRSSRVRSKIGWSMHLFPGEGVYHSQQLLISVFLRPLS